MDQCTESDNELISKYPDPSPILPGSVRVEQRDARDRAGIGVETAYAQSKRLKQQRNEMKILKTTANTSLSKQYILSQQAKQTVYHIRRLVYKASHVIAELDLLSGVDNDSNSSSDLIVTTCSESDFRLRSESEEAKARRIHIPPHSTEDDIYKEDDAELQDDSSTSAGASTAIDYQTLSLEELQVELEDMNAVGDVCYFCYIRFLVSVLCSILPF